MDRGIDGNKIVGVFCHKNDGAMGRKCVFMNSIGSVYGYLLVRAQAITEPNTDS